jgi:hypothetical protein
MLVVGQSRNRVSFPGRGEKLFSFPKGQDWFWRTTQPPIQWTLGPYRSGQPGRDACFSPDPLPRLRMHAVIASLPRMPLGRSISACIATNFLFIQETGNRHKDTDLTVKRRVTITTFARGNKQSRNALPVHLQTSDTMFTACL